MFYGTEKKLLLLSQIQSSLLKRSLTAENELRRMGFNFENKHKMLWTISYRKKDLDTFTIRPVT